MAKKYFWLKLKSNFFYQPKIKKLRRIAGGDTYTIIYLKMQLYSLEDEGFLYFEGIEDDFYEELALKLDEDVENVRVTISFLLQQGLMEMVDESEYLMTETKESIASESDSASRMRKLRNNKASLCDGHVTASDKNVTTEIDIDIEKDIDKELEIKKEIETESDIELETDSVGTEQSSDCQLPIVYSLPLNDNSNFKIYQPDIDKWAELYPAVDIEQELKKMWGWLDSNPTKRKTARGIKRFINSWLSREQDKPRISHSTTSRTEDMFAEVDRWASEVSR